MQFSAIITDIRGGTKMQIPKIKSFYENTIKKPYKQIEYTGYAALATTAMCFVKSRPRKIHKTFGILTGLFSLTHLILIKYYQSFKVAAATNKEN